MTDEEMAKKWVTANTGFSPKELGYLTAENVLERIKNHYQK